MLQYLRNLPEKDVTERRRFVVVATSVSFVAIVVVWLLLVSFGQQYRASRPQPAEASPEPSPNGFPVTVVASPETSPAVDAASPSPELPIESPLSSPAVLPVSSVRRSLPSSVPVGPVTASPIPPPTL